MPRSLARVIVNLGFQADDVRDIELRGKPDEDVLAAAVALDAIVVTRDRGFKNDGSGQTTYSRSHTSESSR